MTDPQANPADTPPAVTGPDSSVPSQPAAQETAPAAVEPAVSDLPEYEPLTPELVEDEALRGDFMLRWAVVLLAFLLGCREISDTMTLVRIRTGEHIASHGFLPPATDVFSFTANDRPWINPAWLFDLILAGVHGAGGGTGWSLSIFTGLLAAVTFYFLVHINRTGTPTWWTAVCAALTLPLVQLHFTALPELVTLLGVVWTLRGLLRWSQTGQRNSLWCVAGSLAVWASLDPRAFIGGLLLLAFWLGAVLTDRVLKRPSRHADARLSDLSKAVGMGVAALLINPFGWHAWLSPWTLYLTELPAVLSYMPLDTPERALLPGAFSPQFRSALSVQTAVGLVVVVAAVITGLMTWKTLEAGLLIALLMLGGLAACSGHELSSLVVVASVFAALHGQDWYRANCRQEYSTATLEVLWSRFGRAATVLGLVVVAWLGISGRMTGADGRRVGLGFSPALAAAVAGSADDLKELPEGRIFVFRPDQGDLLIWHRQPTFIDSRLGLYAQGGENILALHNQARYSLQPKPKQVNEKDERQTWMGRDELWKDAFDRFQVTYVTPRIWGLNPDYTTYVVLFRHPQWSLLKAGSTLALFAGKDSRNEAVRKLVTQSRTSFSEEAFRVCRKPEVKLERTDWPQPYTAYQRFLSLPSRPVSMHTQRAMLEIRTLTAGLDGAIELTNGDAFGLACLSIRDASAGLAEDVRNLESYRSLASSFGLLRTLEQTVLARAGRQGPTVDMLRLHRSALRIFALRQGLRLRPDDLDLLTGLCDEYLGGNQTDLAGEMIQKTLDVLAELPDLDEFQLGLARRLTSVRKELNERLNTVSDNITRAQADKVPFLQIAVELYGQGLPLKALEIMDQNRAELSSSLGGQIQYAVLLLECGRYEEAESLFESLYAMPDAPGVSPVWRQQAAWLSIARGNYDGMITRCLDRLRDSGTASAHAMLAVAPFAAPLPEMAGSSMSWPVTQNLAVTQVLYQHREEVTQLRWLIASGYLETGRCKEALATLKDLLQHDPDTSIRPLVVILVQLLSGEELPLDSPRDETPALFEPEPVADPKP